LRPVEIGSRLEVDVVIRDLGPVLDPDQTAATLDAETGAGRSRTGDEQR
jgi:hypothetical protein